MGCKSVQSIQSLSCQKPAMLHQPCSLMPTCEIHTSVLNPGALRLAGDAAVIRAVQRPGARAAEPHGAHAAGWQPGSYRVAAIAARVRSIENSNLQLSFILCNDFHCLRLDVTSDMYGQHSCLGMLMSSCCNQWVWDHGSMAWRRCVLHRHVGLRGKAKVYHQVYES